MLTWESDCDCFSFQCQRCQCRTCVTTCHLHPSTAAYLCFFATELNSTTGARSAFQLMLCGTTRLMICSELNSLGPVKIACRGPLASVPVPVSVCSIKADGKRYPEFFSS
jgi:hypothetical protein